MRKTWIALATAALTLLAGCGSDSPEPVGLNPTVPIADARHNDTDVVFLQAMVAHHGQGLELIKLARTRNLREDVALLAGAIEATQTTELQVMQSWLTGWEKPTTGNHDLGTHASHDGTPITREAEMASLRAADENQLQTTFLNLLIGHQHNAVEMAQVEMSGGANPQTKELANRIAQSRTEQIKLLLTLVAG
ncbi:DUF305 domain-containing protein [Micromonospora sp. NPDC050417]|uniref:DUF305 domain-containing protein n=1 Tax=Micromonospora sp. NPDC050417 TaxID=3364280 RepID=UPI0037A7489B